jgi:hypothetical protein
MRKKAGFEPKDKGSIRNKILTVLAVIAVVVAAIVQSFWNCVWWVGFDLQNCPGCQPKIDWAEEKAAKVVGNKERKEFDNTGVVLLRNVLPLDKVQALVEEVENNLSNTFMTDLLAKATLPHYKRYEHHLDTRSEQLRDWAVQGPLGKWAAELLGADEVRLYNVEAIYHNGPDSPRPCQPAWHRDTIAAPFPMDVRSVTFNMYFDDIGADAPNGDGLIYMSGSHKDLAGPPSKPSIIEPYMRVGDLLAHHSHAYHTTSGRGCWHRRSLQFRYVATKDSQGQPTRFQFDLNRWPHGPIPWSLAQSPELFPHGLNDGDILQGPGYPLVYPEPDETEHRPLTGNVWSVKKMLDMAKTSEGRSKELPKGFLTLDGPILDPADFESVENDNPKVSIAMHRRGPTFQRYLEAGRLL